LKTSLVSVIVAVYNGEKTLAASLRSLVAQDYHPVEVVVVDDGSEDRSGEIAREFDAVRVVRQENAGPAAARNAGVALATGELLAFLDADDEALPRKLSLQVEHLQCHPRVGCVLGRQEVEFVGIEQPSWMKRDAIFGDLGGVGFTTAMVRRDAFKSVGGFNPDRKLQGSEDRDLMVRLRAAGIVIEVLPEILILRNFTGSNLTLQQPRSMLLTSLKSKLDRERASVLNSDDGAT
jgi:glycosyltransferase involved in cell wall biosynthesis